MAVILKKMLRQRLKSKKKDGKGVLLMQWRAFFVEKTY